MTNMVDWLNATADYMAIETPLIWDKEKAMRFLTESYYQLEDRGRDFDEISCGGYSLERSVEYEDFEVVNTEYRLSKVISSAVFFPQDEDMYAVSWLDGSAFLPPMNLPTLEDQLPD